MGARDTRVSKQAKLASGLKPATAPSPREVLAAALDHAVRLNPALAVHRDSCASVSAASRTSTIRAMPSQRQRVRHLIAAAYAISDALAGLFPRGAAETGSRSSQLARAAGAATAGRSETRRVAAPRSKKGRSRKAGERAAVPVSVELAARLGASALAVQYAAAVAAREQSALATREGDHSREFRRVVKAAGCRRAANLCHLTAFRDGQYVACRHAVAPRGSSGR